MTRRFPSRLATLAASALPLVVAAACSSTPSNSTSSSTNAGSGSSVAGNPTTTVASSYATIAELDKALIDHGIPCQLSYPGIKDDVSQAELSICTIDSEQAFLRVWQTPDLVKRFVASPDGQTGTLAVGANWTISLQTGATATKVADAIGGSVPGAPTTTTTTTTTTPKRA